MANTARPPADALVERFRADLDRLISPSARVGVAVSGGPDSLALLLLAAAARPGAIEAATVDHALRAESPAEAEYVADICARIGVPHQILTAKWKALPQTAIQEAARNARYALLGAWAAERGLAAVLAGHHADDQAETLLMRLQRGAGVRGLAGMRPLSRLPDGGAIVRPLLGWRRAELEQICRDCGLVPLADPSNSDEKFERVRVRQSLGAIPDFDIANAAASAAHLAAADEALDWAVNDHWSANVTEGEGAIAYRLADAPGEIRRRIVQRAVQALATEGSGEDYRGRELDRLIAKLEGGEKATLRGVLCSGGPEQWRFVRAPARRA